MSLRGSVGLGARRRVLACGVVLAVCGVLGLGAAAAGAEPLYGSLCPSLGSPAFCVGPLPYPFGVAVDDSGGPAAGDVYVASMGLGGQATVSRYSASGERESFTGLNPNIDPVEGHRNELHFPGFVGAVAVAVETATGDFYVTSRPEEGPNVVDEFTSTGEPVPAGSFDLPAGAVAVGVAVDNSDGPSKGDIYVSDEADGGVVDKFGAGGVLLKQTTVDPEHPLTPYTLAVDSNGMVYVANNGGQVQKFSEELVFEGAVGKSGSEAVAVDPAGGDVYIAYETFVQEYLPTGRLVGSVFGEGLLAAPRGVAVSGSTHDVYVSNSTEASHGVIFGLGEAAPEGPVTEAPSEVSAHAALLHGELRPLASSEESVEFYFAYNTGGGCEGADQTAVGSAKGIAVPESAEVSGLAAGTQYTFCLVARNGFGTTVGPPVSFTTASAPPTVESESVSGETDSEADLSAVVNPEGLATTCEFQYASEEAFNATGWASASSAACSPQALGEGLAGVPTGAHLSGLGEGVSYDYRVLASNALSPAEGTPGPDQTFQTLSRPVVSAQAASQIHPSDALLSATVNPRGVDTTYHFAYGPTAGYGSSVPLSDTDVGAGGEGVVALQTLSGLQPATTYHYALVASSKAGIRIGPDGTFTTAPAALPVVNTGLASGVSQNGASISGTIDPQGVPTSYEFDVGTDTTYGSRVFGEAGAGVEAKTFTLSLAGLAAGTLYHYRLVATNSYGTVYGADQTFTTPGFPTSLLVSPQGAPLVPAPAFSPPSNAGTGTIPQAPAKTKHKAKKKIRRRGRKASRAARGKGRSGR